jgi:DNA-binding NtrC family response regulator
MNSRERAFLVSIERISNSNPFLPEWIEAEREILGPEFVEGPTWSILNNQGLDQNLERVKKRAEQFLKEIWPKLLKGDDLVINEWNLYELFARWIIYHRYSESFHKLIVNADHHDKTPPRITLYRQFERDVKELFRIPGAPPLTEDFIAHMFAFLFQVRRAFYYTFTSLVGHSMPIARLRAAVWQSIFTRDVQLHYRLLHKSMADFCTLVVGPTGTGKELVARAIALASFIPFDPGRLAFSEDHRKMYLPINLAALAPTLLESELFGHKQGAFTGAIADRKGWLEAQQRSTIFLDEIGEIDQGLQVKLLRVLQTRTFHRLGDMEPRDFKGKIIAATNRNLVHEMESGKFRRDFYYRLCSDMIVTPSLREQLAASPDEMTSLVAYLLRRITGAELDLTNQIVSWIEKHLGLNYAWPGNMRELEQCVRNILVRGEYSPQLREAGAHSAPPFVQDMTMGRLTAEQLLKNYAELVFSKAGNYAETARSMALDRRTVRRLLNGNPLPPKKVLTRG